MKTQRLGKLNKALCIGDSIHSRDIDFDDGVQVSFITTTTSGYSQVVETPSPCPLTNSTHEKALVRVVEKRIIEDTQERACNFRADFIQVLCACGKTLSENEVTPLTRT